MPIPFLPAAIAAFTAINGAHYWHQQLKPFESEQERIEAIKEQLAESTFTASWTEDAKKQVVTNPDFISMHKLPSFIYPTDYFGVAFVPTFTDKYMLGIENSEFFYAKNRHAIKQLYKKFASELGHEGAHITQGLKRLHKEPENRKHFELDADIQGLNATLNSDALSSPEKLYAILNKKAHLKSDCQKNHKPLNGKLFCQEHDQYPSCPERIDITEKYIPHARLEIINDTIRDEIAWQ